MDTAPMWLALAFAASMLWGAHYALSGQALRTLSPAALMVLLSVCQTVLFGTLLAAQGGLGQLAPAALRPNAGTLAGLIALSAAANLCIATSIQGRNATVAGLVEMTYPIFTAAFAYLLFREAHLTPRTLLGAIVAMAGVAIVATGR